MTLEHAMRQVLAEMTLVQYGSTTSWSSSGGGDGPEKPSGDSRPLVDEWRERWERDPSDRTLQGARDALDAWKRRPTQDTGDDTTVEDWVLSDGEGYTAEQVARNFGIADSRVRRIRMRNNREPEFGKSTETVTRAERKDQSRVRVITLASQGMTIRQIHVVTDVPRETVRRWIRGAA
jgi:transposase